MAFTDDALTTIRKVNLPSFISSGNYLNNETLVRVKFPSEVVKNSIEDDALIIEQAISSSEQGNTTEFNALREYLLALDENNNSSNKNTIKLVFNAIKEITRLNKYDNDNIQRVLDPIKTYKYYKIINDYHLSTRAKINEYKKIASSALKNLKSTRDINCLRETKEVINKLPEGTYKSSLMKEYSTLELSINLDYYLSIAKETKSKDDLSKLLYYVNRINNSSQKQQYLNIIKNLEKEKIDYAYSTFRAYYRDKNSISYIELSECIKEIVSPEVVKDLKKKLSNIKSEIDIKDKDEIRKEVTILIDLLDVKDMKQKRQIYNLLDKLNSSDRRCFKDKIQYLEKPLYDELVNKIRKVKKDPQKELLEEVIQLYSNIISESYKSNLYNDYKDLKSKLVEVNFKESNQYKDIINRIEEFEEEKNLNNKIDLIKLINTIPHENIRKELLNRISKVNEGNIKRLTLKRINKTFFNHTDIKGEVKVKIYANGYLLDELYTDGNNIGITSKAYVALKEGDNKIKITVISKDAIATIETVFNKNSLVPKLAKYSKNLKIKSQDITAKKPTDLSIKMANAEKNNKNVFDYVIIASDKSYADNLSIIQLASRLDSPILLLENEDNESAVKVLKYIEENVNKKGKVFIIGGNEVISKSFEDRISINKERIYGLNRYETNKAILGKCDLEKGTPIIICSGNGYADALSISPVSGIMDYPILLVSDELTESDIKFIDKVNPSQIFILGGNSVVIDKVETSLNNYNVKRIAGSDRYDTSKKIRNYFKETCFEVVKNSIEDDALIEVCGEDYVSAILGGVYGCKFKIPVVLIDNNLKNTIRIR